MSKKNYTVYANCQGHALAKVLNSSPNFSSEYNYIEVEQIQNIDTNYLDDIIESVIPQVDLFIYQPISEKYKNNSRYSSKYMVDILKKDCRYISFPSCYFRGYNPEIRTLKDENNVNVSVPLKKFHNLDHDANIILGFIKKDSVSTIINQIIDDNFYSEQFVEQTLANTFEELSKREKRFFVDIRISLFILNNFKTERLFHTVNHPTSRLIKFIAESILDILHIEKDFDKIPDFLNFLSYPVYTSAQKRLKLEFDSLPKYGILGELVDLEKIIKQYIEFYQTIPREILIKNIENWNLIP